MPPHPNRSELSKHWDLDPNIVFLNHGSFGACPREILDFQTQLRQKLERDPVKFMETEARELWAEALNTLSNFINADPEGMAFVTNATSGVNTVLKSLDLQPRDEILVPDHSYQACWNSVDFVTKKTGAKTVVVPLPFPVENDRQVIDTILSHTTPKSRLALIDTVTSPTGLLMPFEALINELQSRDIDVLLDAAHGPGIVPLNIKDLNPAYATGNAHKWLCTPKAQHSFTFVRIEENKSVHCVSVTELQYQAQSMRNSGLNSIG